MNSLSQILLKICRFFQQVIGTYTGTLPELDLDPDPDPVVKIDDASKRSRSDPDPDQQQWSRL
jgi:hypothetical protein